MTAIKMAIKKILLPQQKLSTPAHIRDESTIIISCRRQQEENTWNEISENGKHFPIFAGVRVLHFGFVKCFHTHQAMSC